jgi:hypothetical protein
VRRVIAEAVVRPFERIGWSRLPGIDDLQSSSWAGVAAGGGVECNSTIPGSVLNGGLGCGDVSMRPNDTLQH